ncbi:MAG TPA: hypothetical protein VGF59_08675 [Bryobacteraceae bacterium]|jgi:hypothetical protein
MVKKTILATLGFLAFSPVAAMAAGDPTILIDLGGDSPAFTTGFGNVQPVSATNCDGFGNCDYDFFNDTGLITELKFEMDINAGLNPALVADNFPCAGASHDPALFFGNCTVTYNQSSGHLTFDFLATEPPDGDETPPNVDANEPFEDEGIPTGQHFVIHLQGWAANLTDTVDHTNTPIYSGTPTFTNSFVAMPEPAAPLLLGLDLLFVSGIVAVIRRKKAR